jgi:hypothetical protein
MGVEAAGVDCHSHFEYGDHEIQSLRTVSAAASQVLRLRGLTSFLKTKLGRKRRIRARREPWALGPVPLEERNGNFAAVHESGFGTSRHFTAVQAPRSLSERSRHEPADKTGRIGRK